MSKIKLDYYKKIVEKNGEKDNKVNNMVVAFLSGGIMSFLVSILSKTRN